MSDSAHVIRVTTYPTVHGKADEVRAAARAVADHARNSDGCFGAQVCRQEGADDLVVLISRWQDRQSLQDFESANQKPQKIAVHGLVDGSPTTVHYVSM